MSISAAQNADLQLISSKLTSHEISISIVAGTELSPPDRKGWMQIQEENSKLQNPFFRLEFTEALAHVRPSVKVAILKRGFTPIAYWPYQENIPGIATPVGEKIGCMHGVICREGAEIDGGVLARLCGLKAWRFDHLLTSQQIFTPYIYEKQESSYMDLSEGFEAYCANRKKKGHSNRALAELGRKCRRMEREIGPLRLEMDCKDPAALELLVKWKTRQMRMTGRRDLFVQSPWVIPLVENTLRMDGDDFRGMMSVLYLKEEPIAIHYGLRSFDHLHGIFFAFNRKYSHHSPGMALVLQLVKQAHDHGINRIDMGKGEERYKQMWKSGGTLVSVGAWESKMFPKALGRPAHKVKRAISRSWIGEPLKRTVGQFQRFSDS